MLKPRPLPGLGHWPLRPLEVAACPPRRGSAVDSGSPAAAARAGAGGAAEAAGAVSEMFDKVKDCVFLHFLKSGALLFVKMQDLTLAK